MSLIRISESDNFVVAYDKERGMYRVSIFENNHFQDEHWFDAYEDKEVNEEYIGNLRKTIAEQVECKMCYMGCCPNEMDTYLNIIDPDNYPSIRKAHCDTDCWCEDCNSYQWGVNNKDKAKTIKRVEDEIQTGRWWAGYCPRCGQILSYNFADKDRYNRKQYCWKCGQLIDFS